MKFTLSLLLYVFVGLVAAWSKDGGYHCLPFPSNR